MAAPHGQGVLAATQVQGWSSLMQCSPAGRPIHAPGFGSGGAACIQNLAETLQVGSGCATAHAQHCGRHNDVWGVR